MCGVSSHNKARIFFCWRPWAAFSILFTISSYVSIMIIVMLIKAGFCSQLECSSVVVLLAEGTLKIFLVISSGEAGRTGVVSCWVKVSVYFLKGQLNIFLDSIDLQCNLRSQYLQASFLYPPAKGTWARDLRISKTHKKSRIETPKLGNLYLLVVRKNLRLINFFVGRVPSKPALTWGSPYTLKQVM